MQTCNSCTFTARRSLRLYEYGGAVSDHAINLSVADVKLYAFLEYFDLVFLNGWAPRAAELVQELKSKLSRGEGGDSITTTDERVLFALNSLMVKYPDALTSKGEKEQWVVVYEYLRHFYDSLKHVNRIDDLVRAVNLQMGLLFATEQVTPEEALEMMNIDIDVEDWGKVVPAFVITGMLENGAALEPFEGGIKEIRITKAFNELYAAIEAA